MKAQIKLGRIFGVEIGLHYGWFISDRAPSPQAHAKVGYVIR